MIFYGLIGAGGHGRETMPVFREMIRDSERQTDHRLMFVVEGVVPQERVNGYPVVSLDEYLAMEGVRLFNIAIADAPARARIADLCLAAGARPQSIISKSALVLESNEIGVGAILSPLSSVTSNVRIGRFFHANIYARVAHDCVIGDFVTFAPSAQCNGNVVVDDYAYIGTGAVLKEGSKERPLVIGKGAQVGMGAVVTKDVPSFATVVGNPARPLVK
jgi:sugar O-acyltransferase (sialic acid O-acetyltransferase NeuD family)